MRDKEACPQFPIQSSGDFEVGGYPGRRAFHSAFSPFFLELGPSRAKDNQCVLNTCPLFPTDSIFQDVSTESLRLRRVMTKCVFNIWSLFPIDDVCCSILVCSRIMLPDINTLRVTRFCAQRHDLHGSHTPSTGTMMLCIIQVVVLIFTRPSVVCRHGWNCVTCVALKESLLRITFTIKEFACIKVSLRSNQCHSM